MNSSKTKIVDNIFLDVNTETIEIEINKQCYSQLNWREAIKSISNQFAPHVRNKNRFGKDGTIFSYSYRGYWKENDFRRNLVMLIAFIHIRILDKKELDGLSYQKWINLKDESSDSNYKLAGELTELIKSIIK